jgi:DNA ligase-4
LEALVHKHGGEYSQAQLSDLSAVVIAPDEKSELLLSFWRESKLDIW